MAKHMCNKISVMYPSRIAESGTNEQVFSNPMHPYTQALKAAVPVPDPGSRSEKKLPTGEIPSSLSPPPGCRFHRLCPYVFDRCRVEEPELVGREPHHLVSCHLYDSLGPITR